MKELMQETELKLSKSQVQNVINDYTKKENGLNDLFTMMINGLMLSERQVFLEDHPVEGNKGNGYRRATRSGIGSKLELLFIEIEFLIVSSLSFNSSFYTKKILSE